MTISHCNVALTVTIAVTMEWCKLCNKLDATRERKIARGEEWKMFDVVR